jgi:phosphate transport system permease protein
MVDTEEPNVAPSTRVIGVTLGTATPAIAQVHEGSRQDSEVAASDAVQPLAPHALKGSRNPGDLGMTLITRLAAVVIVAASVVMFVVLIIRAQPSISHFGPAFVTMTQSPAYPFSPAAAIEGTLYCSAIALVVAAPIGILAGIYLSQMAPSRLRLPLGFIIELLAAIPSIIYGFWALLILVPLMSQYVNPYLNGHLGFLPLFSEYQFVGVEVLTAAGVLAVMILPTISAISRDAMLAVPSSQKEALLALGATRWEVVRKVVLPSARAGIVGATTLALGRALGETMAVTMVIGGAQAFHGLQLLQPGTTMPATIVSQLPDATGISQAALIELALILLIITFVVNCAARVLVRNTALTGDFPGTTQFRVFRKRSFTLLGGLHRSVVRTTGRKQHRPATTGNVTPATRSSGIPFLFLWRSYAVRRARNLAGLGITGLSIVIAFIPLIAIIGFVFQRGARSISPQFFLKPPPIDPMMSGGGMEPMIIGSAMIIGLTCVIGIPIGLLSGIYLAREGDGPVPSAVRFIADVIAGTPSIIAGVVAYALFIVPTHTWSAYSAAVALALLMFPTVTRATELAIRAVPSELREAALAVGAPEWKTMFRVVVPTALGGIVTAIVLGIARVAGETAPLVFTVFGSSQINLSLTGPIGTLPFQIFQYATSGWTTEVNAAYAGALVLFCMVMLLNIIARLLSFRFTRNILT